jgi:hypothetical protein
MGTTADDRYAVAKHLFVLSACVIAIGVAICGSFDPTTGGVIVLVGWTASILALHRLGRTGSVRR